MGEALAVLDRRLDAASAAPVALALSGGGDSMALLHMAAAWARARRRPLLALTVDHRLNPESAAWTRFAGEAALRAGAAWRGLVWTGPKPTAGLSAAARSARHALLADVARLAGARVVLFAHNDDDQRESAKLRLDTPSHGRLREWSPSPAWPEGRGVFILRPLLTARRAALRCWLAARGASWLEDPANEDLRFARARIRAAGGLGAGEPLENEPGTLKTLARQALLGPDGQIALARKALAGRAGGDAAAERFLAVALLSASGGRTPPRGASVRRLLERLRTETPVVATLSGAQVRANSQVVSIVREAGAYARAPARPLALRAGEAGVWDGRFEVTATADLLVGPLAGLSTRVPAQDRAALLRVQASARPALPVLQENGLRRGDAPPPRLPQPFGGGPGFARALAGARLEAACGLVEHERDIPPLLNLQGMARDVHTSYVDDLALA